MRHFVIGTAGHIDHGKSALVQALTGTDPDRLEEEKRRGMTIDLGFAHFDLPSGRRVGIVDVPGHERLIKNMLAGATGIDLVLLVVAADEGVMPQTREHLDILRFLPVRTGVVVLNKIDLVTDQAWLALVHDDLRGLTGGTFLEDAPVLQVSARTGRGVAELISTLDRLLDRLPSHASDAPVRLPVDRAFVMTGFGTVVTGTLWSGEIRKGTELEVLPEGRLVRVRGLQSHGIDMEAAVAGSRVAVNVAGVEKTEVARGNALVTPGAFRPTDLIDARVSLLPDAQPLAHLTRVRMYVGSDEVFGRVALLDRPKLAPGDTAAAQIRLERATVAGGGDPFVLRLYSPMRTIGGGVVIAPHPAKRRRGRESAAAIEQAAAASPEHRLEDLLRAAGASGITSAEIVRQTGLTQTQVGTAVQALATAGRLQSVRGRFYHQETADRLAEHMTRAIEEYHRAQPWRIGMSRDDLKTKVFSTGDDRFYANVLDGLGARGAIALRGGFVGRSGFQPIWSESERRTRDAIAAALAAGGASPPARESLERLSPDTKSFARAFQTLLDDGTVVEAAPGVYFHQDAIAAIKQTVISRVAAHGSITVAALRDTLKTSRKFALTVLEYFDTIKFTRRVGDTRVLVKKESP